MKQVLQYMRNGKTIVAEVPLPAVRQGMVLVRTGASLVSAGTERMLVEFAEKSLIDKARSRPDLVRQVMDKARREGILSTIEATFNRLDQPMALGYSSAGTVMEVGAGVTDFKPGDRVACAGGGFAVHAEVALVPGNLLVPIPGTVDFESASFATLGAIALHGFRLSESHLGERVAIIGMGLLGLLSAGIARAAGCQVFGIDLSPSRVDLANQLGHYSVLRPEAVIQSRNFTSGKGFDSVLICADTSSNDPVELAGKISRDRACVVAVGAVGFKIPRKTYYEKELRFLVSRSYGPGRYDPAYEEGGQDYPFGYIRWTEGRNIAACVELMAAGKLDVKPLISHRFPIEHAPQAYELITGKSGQPFLGVVLTYPTDLDISLSRRLVLQTSQQAPVREVTVGVLGAGNYANAVFLPMVKKTSGVTLRGIASAAGLTSAHAARRYGFGYASSNEQDILTDENINLVAILTRHSSHARLVLAALQAGKNVFCEKPLAINEIELTKIEQALLLQPSATLSVGFNRRFATYAIQLKQFMLATGEPLSMHYRINAGQLPLTHWLHDPAVGGGRIIGEGCHFVDFLTFLAGSLPVSVSARGLPDSGIYHQDNIHITLSFANGSIGTITYLANGNKSFTKERVEVFSGGRVGVLDDFRSLDLIQDGSRKHFTSSIRQDKGHAGIWKAFLDSIYNGAPPPIPYEELVTVSRTTFAVMNALLSGKTENTSVHTNDGLSTGERV